MQPDVTTAQGSQTVDKTAHLLALLPQILYRMEYHDAWSVTYVSNQITPMLGYQSEEIYSMKNIVVDVMVHHEDMAYVREQKATATPDALTTIFFRAISKNGESLPVKDQFTRYQTSLGTWVVEGCITENQPPPIRDRIFNKLQAYQRAVDVNMISSITDRQGNIIYVNENFCRISKYSMEELIGQNHRIVNSMHHPTSFFTNLWKTITSGKLWRGEILNKAKDGTLYWVDSVIIPILDENKKIVNYLSLRMLINDRKEVESHRRKYTHLLEQIAFIVAHDVRGPLCNIMGLTNMLLNYPNSKEETDQALRYLDAAAKELDHITRLLTTFVYENEIEGKVKNYHPNTDDN